MLNARPKGQINRGEEVDALLLISDQRDTVVFNEITDSIGKPSSYPSDCAKVRVWRTREDK